jgi:deoxyribodipyrimidine photo-lyase
MIAARRLRSNFALDRAAEWCRRLQKPLVILEALRSDFPWAGERLRRFVIDGMAANSRMANSTGALYYPYVESARGKGQGLLAALASRAAVIVTDDFPSFFLPRMVASAVANVPVLLEQVDSNGLLPMRAAPKEFSTAYAFRRFLQNHLAPHLLNFPSDDPLAGVPARGRKTIPANILARWPMANLEAIVSRAPAKTHATSAALRGPVRLSGGSDFAQRRLRSFLRRKLDTYAEKRNEALEDATSGLSPYLHFGHISTHEIFSAVAKQERWRPERLALRATGAREGWWGMSRSAEAFLDQLITWRELGFNRCHFRQDYDRYSSLPAWARETLARHAGDPRPYKYSLDEFDRARTHDPLWNAAQTQLVTEGRIHNYLRMLWGKKILEWSRSPREALKVMVELNNRYALDGRDPNSYSGIFWCLGLYDRPWGPERQIFGTVRYMSSANTARKLKVKEYLRKYSPDNSGQGRLPGGKFAAPQLRS